MYVKHYKDVSAKKVEEGATNTTIRWLIAESEGAGNFYMRLLEIGPGGNTPRHSHDWEHEVYILSGAGTLRTPDGDRPLSAGDCVFVPGGELHQFRSADGEEMKFLCLIPRS